MPIQLHLTCTFWTWYLKISIVLLDDNCKQWNMCLTSSITIVNFKLVQLQLMLICLVYSWYLNFAIKLCLMMIANNESVLIYLV